MKPTFKFTLILTFFALFSFYSCQDEIIEETPIDQEELFVPESQLANLVMSASFNNSTIDDVLDDANCFSVNLPVTIVANGITITIDTHDDLEILEEIFDEFTDDDDVLEFFFPITIILNDHTEVHIENEEQLDSFIERCENIDDNAIECIDFVYPISFSLYNSQFQIIETVVIDNKRQLHHFLERLEEDSQGGVVLASLNFPVELKYEDGNVIEVHSNQELERALNEAREECRNYERDCSEEFLVKNLVECYWRIASYNEDDVFRPYVVMFKENGELLVKGENGVITEGFWETSISENHQLEVVIDGLSELSEALEGSWIVVECDEGRFKLVRGGTSNGPRMVLEKECEDDLPCTAQEISRKFKECYWYAGTNLYSNVIGEQFHFGPEGVVEVINSVTDEVSQIGEWSVSRTDHGTFMELVFDNEPLSLLNKGWKIIECGDGRIKMINGDHYIIFEQECYDCEDLQKNYGDSCEIENQEGTINENCECEVNVTPSFECFEGYTKTVCDDDTIDGFTTFNLEALFPNCPQDDVEVTYHLSYADAENGVEAISSSYTNTANPQTIYARVTQAGSINYVVREVGLAVENCGTTGCSETDVDYKLKACHWEGNLDNTNDFNNFDFYFNAENTLVIEGSGTTFVGVWMTYGGTGNVVVEISQLEGNFQMFNGEWVVVECTESQMILHGPDNMELVLNRDCDDEQTPNLIKEIITSGQWLVANYNDSGVDETTDFSNWILDFSVDGTVTATNNETIVGTWSSNYDNGELHIELNFGEQTPFNEFNDNWNVFDLLSDRLELHDISSSDNTLDVLVLEKF